MKIKPWKPGEKALRAETRTNKLHAHMVRNSATMVDGERSSLQTQHSPFLTRDTHVTKIAVVWLWYDIPPSSMPTLLWSGACFKSPETFRPHFGWHNSLCIFITKAPRGTKLSSYIYFYSLYNIWKEQLYRISGSGFHEGLFGPEKFSGLSRNGPQACKVLEDVMGIIEE